MRLCILENSCILTFHLCSSIWIELPYIAVLVWYLTSAWFWWWVLDCEQLTPKPLLYVSALWHHVHMTRKDLVLQQQLFWIDLLALWLRDFNLNSNSRYILICIYLYYCIQNFNCVFIDDMEAVKYMRTCCCKKLINMVWWL